MKKLQVPLDDDLMLLLKTYAFRNNTTIKDLVTNWIDKGLRESAPEPVKKEEQKPIKIPEPPKPEPKKAPSTTNELFPDYIDTGEPLELMETIATGAKVYRTERRDRRGYRILVVKDKDENGEENAYEDIDYYDKI